MTTKPRIRAGYLIASVNSKGYFVAYKDCPRRRSAAVNSSKPGDRANPIMLSERRDIPALLTAEAD